MKTITGNSFDFFDCEVTVAGVKTARFKQSSLPDVVGDGSLPNMWSRILLDGRPGCGHDEGERR